MLLISQNHQSHISRIPMPRAGEASGERTGLSRVLFHLDDPKAMLLEGLFGGAQSRCQTGRGNCACPFREPCRNVTLDDLSAWQANIKKHFDSSMLQYKRVCAVVSSDETAPEADANAAAAIDAADYVIRLGDDPVKGYEARVGSRTTHRLIKDGERGGMGGGGAIVQLCSPNSGGDTGRIRTHAATSLET